MSRRKTPEFQDILAIQLTAKARDRWQRHNAWQDNVRNQLCRSRALLASALNIPMDAQSDVCSCCADDEPLEAANLDEAARKAFDLLSLACSVSLFADEMLSEFNEATAQHIALLSRKR